MTAPCCDYRDHGSGYCLCEEHERSDLHIFGWVKRKYSDEGVVEIIRERIYELMVYVSILGSESKAAAHIEGLREALRLIEARQGVGGEV
jgi:hypothetical protein